MKGLKNEGDGQPVPDTDHDDARLIGSLVADIMDGISPPERPADAVRPAGGCGNRNGGARSPASWLTKCVKVSGGVHAACRTRLDAASEARLSRVAQPFEANVSHWSLGILSRNIHERTVCGETEQIEATASGEPACFTIDA